MANAKLDRFRSFIQNIYYSIGFKAKILVPTLIVIFFAFASFTTYLVNDQKNKLIKALNDKADRITVLLTNSNLGYIWRLDNESLENNVKTFFEDKEITKIVIKDEFENDLINLSRKIKGENDITKKAEFTKDTLSIGTIEVVYTDYYIDDSLNEILYKLIILSLMVYVLVILLITATSNLVLKPLQVIMDKVKILAEGDLTQSLMFTKSDSSGENGTPGKAKGRQTRDEIGILAQNFNNFVKKISEVIKVIKVMSEQLAVSSEEMNTTTQAFTDNAQNQASSVEQITATVEHVSAGMDSVAQDAMEQFTSLKELNSQIEELSRLINEMGTSMQETQKTTEEITERARKGDATLKDMTATISSIQSSSGEMVNIVNIINDISDKINLLSLNAAIEAARAGDAGRGFAVVADEISKLADMTASSISDISKLIKSNEEDIQGGIDSINETVENTKMIIDGVSKISEMIEINYNTTRRQLDAGKTVTDMTNRVRESAEGIKNSADEQKDATAEIVKSIANINDLIQENASGAEEMSANATEVNTAAEELREKIDFFKV